LPFPQKFVLYNNPKFSALNQIMNENWLKYFVFLMSSNNIFNSA